MTSLDTQKVSTAHLHDAHDASELLRQANTAYNARDFEESSDLFQALIDAGYFVGWGKFSLGRIAFLKGDFDSALTHFCSALELEPGHFWFLYMSIETLLALGAGADPQLLNFMRQISRIEWQEIAGPHVSVLEKAALVAWDSENYDAAVAVLEKLALREDANELTLVRVVERSISRDARRMAADRLIATPPKSDFAFRILAKYFSDNGDIQSEVEAHRQILNMDPKDFQAYFSLARALARAGDVAALEDLRKDEKSLSIRQRRFVDLVVFLEREETSEAHSALVDLARLFGEVPLFPGIRLCHMLASSGKLSDRDELLGLLDAFHQDRIEVAQVRLNVCIENKEFDAAFEVFNGHLADLNPRPLSVTLAYIDLLAHSGMMTEALNAADELAETCGDMVNAWRTIAKIYAEVGSHGRVVDVALPHLGVEMNSEIMAMVVRSARNCGRLRDVLASLPVGATERNPAQRAAIEAVLEDLVVLGDSEIVDSLGDFRLPPTRLSRIYSRQPMLTRSVEAGRALMLCADAAYLWPALVAITSAAITNASLFRKAPVYLLAESGEVFRRATAASKQLGPRLNAIINVLDAAEVVGDAGALNARYGFFTAGQSLSLAAYYRIFLASHLRRREALGRALYIDSDVVVRAGLSTLFDLPSDKPLLARPELDRVEVSNAIQLLKMQGTYFNSGVLRFDMEHPEFERCIGRSIEHSLSPDAVRLFQDQCALNVGFQLQHDALPVAFNAFRSPRVDPRHEAELRDAVIVHYIDRPKPWDSLYRLNADEWFAWSDLVSEWVEPETLNPNMRFGLI